MSSAFNLSLPVDIPWERICVSDDMIDRDPCDLKLPPKWQSSLTIYRYVPEEAYQTYEGRKITYLKVSATVSGFQARDKEIQGQLDWARLDVSTRHNVTKLLDSYFPCHGAILQVAVGPGQDQDVSPDRYPYIMDVEPKKRELFELATDTRERASRSFETLNIGKAGGSTRSQEVLDVDTGVSVSGGASYAGAGVQFGYSKTGQWGSKSLNNESAQTNRSTNMGDEQRENFSHTTQISQLYHLLDSYHVGTNRTVFLMTPRPHVLEQPSGFVKGEDFSMRAGVTGCGLVLGRPALENLPRWEARDLGGVYGDCAQVVDGTFVLAGRFAPW